MVYKNSTLYLLAVRFELISFDLCELQLELELDSEMKQKGEKESYPELSLLLCESVNECLLLLLRSINNPLCGGFSHCSFNIFEVHFMLFAYTIRN